ncbi:glycerol kinase GlpK [Candidatus Solincola tengchongensis]|uniref:glycerol kinase GlpK n=1 Tax=Candidatus Solincola tengchongensis TaxID=2900693 RepID=UPI00257F05AF|nr:glycerol kinase GlpK [Candidatus Solincola tengchongensis]
MIVLAIDQGTTGTKCICFDRDQRVVSSHSQEFPQYFPRPGWVEHDAEEIWECTLDSARRALEGAGISPGEVAAVGITNQRETTVIWDRESGKPVRKAIVWQCRRSADICSRCRDQGLEDEVHRKTGLVLDPYFSGTKLTWVMEHEPEIARRAQAGELCFGTVDSWLLYRLTGGRVHATDASNASRTLLFNLHDLAWDEELARIFRVPMSMLPEVRDSSGVFGETDPASFLGITAPVAGIAGDQQAALFGQACFRPGMTKNTYGTGSFVLMNTGDKPTLSSRGLLTTVAWSIGGKATYALEGSIFITGAAVNWLRDGLQIISDVAEVDELASQVEDTGGVYFVPAFVGLGAPYWNPRARALLIGMTRGTTRAHVARAVIESMALQTCDVVEAMVEETGIPLKELRVDGGASVMDMLLQYQADLLGVPVRRPVIPETTSLGAALLAGLATGVWKDLEEIEERWRVDREALPNSSAAERAREMRQYWKRAVERSLDWALEE